MALSAERKATRQVGRLPVPELMSFGVADGAVIYKGALVVLDAGYLKPGSVNTGDIAVGRAEETVDNTDGTDGELLCEVRAGVFLFDSVVGGDAVEAADVGSLCYVYDDHTVSTDATGTSIAGRVVGFSGAQVMVLIGLGVG